MRILLILLLGLISFVSHAQVTYIQKFFDLKRGTDSVFYETPNDYPGAILIHGYLTGKLTGYSFDIGNEVTKRAAVAADQFPEKWERRSQYYQEDRVQHDGRYFIAIMDPPVEVPPINGDYWMEIEILGDPVGDRYFFPTLADTLPRALFPNKLAVPVEWAYDPWVPSNDYYADDVVEFEGVIYQSLSLSTGKDPVSFQQLWKKKELDFIRFFRATDFDSYKIVYARTTNNGVICDVPQMITPLRYDFATGIYMGAGVSFYFQDAIRFLESLKQPLFHPFKSGYRAKVVLFANYNEREIVLTKIKQSLVSGKLKVKKGWIVNQTALSEFKSATSMGNWNLVQDLRTSAFQVLRSKDHARCITIPALDVPVDFADAVQSPSPLRTFTLTEGILNKFKPNHIDTLAIDSLDALPYSVVFRPTEDGLSFLEAYMFPKSEETDKIWTLLKNAARDKSIESRAKPDTNYPWSRTWFDFNIYRARLDSVNLMTPPAPIAEESFPVSTYIIYKRSVHVVGEPSFAPVSVMVSINDKSAGSAEVVNYVFYWSDVKKLLQARNSDVWNNFISQVESGTAAFTESKPVLGLIEE